MAKDTFKTSDVLAITGSVGVTNLPLADLAKTILRMATGTVAFLVGNQIAYSQNEVEWTIESSREACVEFKDWVSEYARCPEVVRSYCNSKKMMPHVQMTVALANQLFPSGSQVSLRVEQDQESDAEWLVVDMEVNHGPVSTIQHYTQFIRQWIKVIPSESRDFIRVTFHAA